MIRTKSPKIKLPKKLSFKNLSKHKLDNGFPLYVVGGSSQNICQLNIIFRAGRFFEQKRMLAALCANMMLKGTRKKTAYEVAESFDFYGAAVNFKANMYTAKLSLYCLSSLLPKVLPLLIEVLEEVSFPEKEIKKTKTKLKQKIALQWEKNGYIAGQHFNQAIFGMEHPFGYFTKSKNLNEIDQADLFSHQQKYWQLNQGAFAIAAGNINKEEIHILNQYLGKLKVLDKTIDTAKIKPIEQKDIHIATKNNLQAAIRVGMPSISCHHKDFNDFEILNTILGGYFGSRLMSNIREEKGYTYGVYSFVNPIMDQGFFCIATDVGAEYKNACLNEIEKEINRLKTEQVAQDELNMVKNYLIGQLMKSVDGSLSMAKTLESFLIFDSDLNEVNKQLDAIHAISAARLQDVANKYLDYSSMYKVVVG